MKPLISVLAVPASLAAVLVFHSIPAQAQATGCPQPNSAGAISPYISAESTTGYQLSFSDEFSGSSLASGKWNTAIWYQSPKGPINYAVKDGRLKIWPQSQGGKFYDRTIDTDGKFYQTYGYFEMCAKLPKSTGPWPAFWLLNHDTAARPEIDIMEAYPGSKDSGWANSSQQPIAYGGTVWRDSNDHAAFQRFGPYPPLSERFNIYAVKWDATTVTYYFNGVQVGKFSVRMPELRMYVLLSLWCGSASGAPSTRSTLTGESNSYEIDYVRVWKLPGQN